MNNGTYGFPKNRTKIPVGINSITNNVDNNLVTATGGDTLNGENGLTFNNSTLNIIGELTQGEDCVASATRSHAEGYQTQAGSDQGYLAATVEGKIQLNAGYGDVTSEYNPGDIILLDDFAFENNYGVQTFAVDNASWDGTNTTITTNEPLSTDCPVVIGNITYGVQNWSGGNSIGGHYAHAEGGSTFAIGAGSHAEGDSTEAYGRVSHTEGTETKALGEYSHAEGFRTTSQGNYSHAEGSSTQAIGNYSHAEGFKTTSQGSYSHAEGYSTQAIGPYSHAEGLSTIASGGYSHTEGNNTIASGSYQHVSGQFNTHGDTTSLFIVGNGVDNATRSDAFKVTPSGSIVLPNTINDAPSWTGTQGEMVFYDNGVGTYRIFVWLGGEWRKVDLT